MPSGAFQKSIISIINDKLQKRLKRSPRRLFIRATETSPNTFLVALFALFTVNASKNSENKPKMNWSQVASLVVNAARTEPGVRVVTLAKGWTGDAYRRKGYGTVIRALVCEAVKQAAKKIQANVVIEQVSTALEENNLRKSISAVVARTQLAQRGPGNNNKNLKNAASWRPVSAYIMNKLGFERVTNNAPNNSTNTTELRLLKLKNNSGQMLPTPKLNAVVNWVLNPPSPS